MTHDAAIDLQGVWVQYQLRNAHHYNLKRTLANAVTRRKESPEVITALADIELRVAKGARVGLTGPNGAGKSTLLAVMAGVLKPTRGRATNSGRLLALLGGPNEGLDPEQTGRENAMSLGVRLGESVSTMEGRLSEIRDFSGLGDRFEHPVYTYSSGMMVRVRFSTITSIKADVLLVDEGIGAADADFSSRASERLAQFFGAAATLVLATHSPSLLDAHCTSEIALIAGHVARADA